jgi:uncharacterized protein YukE
MAANTSIVTSSVITATSQHKRDYSERIRRLYPELTKFIALVKGSNLDAYGKVAYSGKGMITKRSVKRMDPEWATYSPIEVQYTATGGSATEVDIADTSFFQTGDIVVNTRTGEVAIVNTLTSGTALAVTAVTGTTFSCSAGDIITMLSSSFEEGTSRYSNITNELTSNKTYLQIFREGVSIADTVKMTPQYTDEGMLERYMTDKTAQTLRKLEGSFLFSKTATNGTTTVTIGGTAYPLYSMNGLNNYAGSATQANGGFSWETFNAWYEIMPKTMKADETVYMICGRNVAQTMNQWAQNSYLSMGSNADELKFGKKVKTFIMGGSLDIELLVHDQYDTGGYANTCTFFQSSDLEYLFMEGMDLNIRENAELPSTMGTTNIIEGAVGLRSISNGNCIKTFTNLL